MKPPPRPGIRVLTARLDVLRPRRPAPPRGRPPRPRTPERAGRAVSARRSAAAAVLFGAALFVGIQVGTGLAISTEASPLRDPLYFDKLALLRSQAAFGPTPPAGRPVSVLFVGSSRTLNAVDARAAGGHLTASAGRPVGAFNFGLAGAGPVTNAVYVRRLLADGVRPDFVLVEVHPVFLAGQRPDPPEARWLLPFRLRPGELPVVRRMGFPAPTPATHGPRGFLASVCEYRFLILDRYAPFFLMSDARLNGGHEPDAHGFSRLADEVTPARRAALLGQTFRVYADDFPGYRPTGSGVAAVRDTLGQCRAAGSRAGLVVMPESSEMRGWYPPDGLRELDALLAGLAAEYGVPVFDARTWVPDQLSEDGHHLTGAGADLLTDRLCREALAPWIARTLDPEPRPAP